MKLQLEVGQKVRLFNGREANVIDTESDGAENIFKLSIHGQGRDIFCFGDGEPCDDDMPHLGVRSIVSHWDE